VKRIVLTVILLGAVGGGAWFGLRALREKTEQEKEEPLLTADVARRDITFAVTALGDVVSAEQVIVKPETSGRIKDIHVEIGDVLKQGALMISLDDKDLLTEKASAETEIQGATLKIEKAKRNYDRTKELFSKKLVSQEEYDNDRIEWELAINAADAARKKLAQVEDKLEKTRIVAPFDCTVLAIVVNPGQVVTEAKSVSSGTDLMQIADLAQLIVQCHINQVDITEIKVNQPVEITVDAASKIEMKGKVRLIAPVATIKNSIKGFSTEILITEKDPRAKIGMTARLRLPVKTATNALSVPISAVFPDGTNKVLYVQTPAGHEKRAVNLGISDAKHVEVLTGVTDGDKVLLERPPEKVKQS
jgi:RND family efflux transporter MFP subunit